MRNKRVFAILASLVLLAVFVFLAVFNINSRTSKKSNGCLGSGCAGCNGCKGKGVVNSTYYSAKENQLLDTLKKRQEVFINVLRTSYPEQDIANITKETAEEFVKLIPQIPYIGGDANPMTEDIEQAAMVLAFYRVESRYGRSADDVGNVVIKAIKDEMSKYPKWFMRLNGSKFFSGKYIEKVREDAEVSQERQYAGAWVTDFIKGDGKEFDYGFNHTECGIVKFFHEQNADELIPYLCKLDFVYSDIMDEGLIRTNTLAEGGEFCDFRFKRVENRKMDLMIFAAFCFIVFSLISIAALIIRKIYIIRSKPKGTTLL